MTRAERVIARAVEANGLARGALEAVRALERREARLVFLAADADRPELIETVRSLARAGGVPIVDAHDRKTLGRWAQIERPAAVLAITAIADREAFLAEVLAEVPGAAAGLAGLQALARASGADGGLDAARAALATLADAKTAADPAAREHAIAALFLATLRLAGDAGLDLARVADRLTLADWLART